MPTNLNALIRYKQIDACLRNPYVDCTIEKFREVCTHAMGEFRGIYKKVSERTIRDDIRVMRSNMLGFNAPIEFENGKYVYTEKEFSIFKIPLTELSLLKDVFSILSQEKINSPNIDKLLSQISILINEPEPEAEKEVVFLTAKTKNLDTILLKEQQINMEQSRPIKHNRTASSFIQSSHSKRKRKRIKPSILNLKEESNLEHSTAVLLWKEVLSVL